MFDHIDVAYVPLVIAFAGMIALIVHQVFSE